jgi:exodeoxyribonuclease VII small subunit
VRSKKQILFGANMAKTSKASKNSETLVENLTYEEAMSELEGIVESLEGEQNPLEDSMKLFERGQALAVYCGTLLESAQLKVQKLVGETITPFEEELE